MGGRLASQRSCKVNSKDPPGVAYGRPLSDLFLSRPGHYLGPPVGLMKRISYLPTPSFRAIRRSSEGTRNLTGSRLEGQLKRIKETGQG